MIRTSWSARKLFRHVSPAGIFGRPTLAFRVRASTLPSVLPPFEDGSCYRPYNLRGLWPNDLIAVFESMEHGWKYLDIEPRGAYVEVYLKGYSGRCPRPNLAVVADAINNLQGRGLRIDVRS